MSSQYQLLENLSVILEKYFSVLNLIEEKKHQLESSLSFDPLKIKQLFFKIYLHFISDPETLMKYQMSFVQAQFITLNNILNNFNQKQEVKPNSDKRFDHQLWHDHIIFHWLKEAYFTYSKWCEEVLKDLPDDKFDNLELKRINFVIKQLIDSLSPSNFVQLNPEVIDTFIKTSGSNLIVGLDNLIKDIKKSQYVFQVSTSDESKFIVGKNLATT